ncbi:hypothetical protein BDZ91DRAFT_727161 [Kalaharituber pfeilii]|nr:hypothetical protein BDZ91DRAFT_727161 [Kalaharituber pfeilii]
MSSLLYKKFFIRLLHIQYVSHTRHDSQLYAQSFASYYVFTFLIIFHVPLLRVLIPAILGFFVLCH